MTAHYLAPARQPGESRADYVRRREWGNATLRRQLAPASGYVPGPHKTHRPKNIQITEVVKGAAVLRQVTHPGTLRRAA